MKFFPDPILDNRVLSFRQWCELNGFSEATGRQLLRMGNGPVTTQLSERRIGITVANNQAWQNSRARPANRIESAA